jgi:RNA polymerase sigma-70 factor (ECF subfamily)
MEETIAIQRLKQNDLSGLEYLVRKYQLPAIRASYLIVRNRQTAEDIVQQVFIRVYERIGQYDENRPFAPWFFRIVINDSVKFITRERSVVSLDILEKCFAEIDFGDLVGQYPNPEDALQHAEMIGKLWQAIGELNPDQRAAFVLRYYFSFSIPELVDELESPFTTIKWRLQSARKRLLKKLKER